jgi:hypothetical protein
MSWLDGLTGALESVGSTYAKVETARNSRGINNRVTAQAPEQAQEMPSTMSSDDKLFSQTNYILAAVAVGLVLLLIVLRK